MNTEINFRSFHQRQDRMPNITFSEERLTAEQRYAGGVEDSIIFATSDSSKNIKTEGPRNPIRHPERIHLVPPAVDTLPQKGIIYFQAPQNNPMRLRQTGD